VLSLRAADSFTPFHCEAGEGLGMGDISRRLPTLLKQTESKGNFCLITVYSYIAMFQPQNSRAKTQTFSNDFARPHESKRIGVRPIPLFINVSDLSICHLLRR
jgi:hypothetical protein